MTALRTEILMVRMTPREKEELAELAERDGRLMGPYIRRLIAEAAQRIGKGTA